MDPQLMEWGPAHLRDEATLVDVEPTTAPTTTDHHSGRGFQILRPAP